MMIIIIWRIIYRKLIFNPILKSILKSEISRLSLKFSSAICYLFCIGCFLMKIK